MPALTLQVGANSGQQFQVELFDARTKSLGIDTIKVISIKENVENYNYNITSAESRISDIDMAKELVKMTKNSIIEQSAQSILTQAKKYQRVLLI